MNLPREITGRELYEEIWVYAHNVLTKESRFLQRENIWWTKQDWKEQLENNKEDGKGLKPFIIKMVNRQGQSCSECEWTKKCNGCVIEPDNEIIPKFMKKCHLVIEWQSQMIENDYNPKSNEIMKHFTSLSSKV